MAAGDSPRCERNARHSTTEGEPSTKGEPSTEGKPSTGGNPLRQRRLRAPAGQAVNPRR